MYPLRIKEVDGTTVGNDVIDITGKNPGDPFIVVVEIGPDDGNYLPRDFDPTKAPVARLRCVLVFPNGDHVYSDKSLDSLPPAEGNPEPHELTFYVPALGTWPSQGIALLSAHLASANTSANIGYPHGGVELRRN